MMKIFFIFCAIVSLAVSSYARCSYGCSCYDDSTCEYYCGNYMCQLQTPLWNKCSSYFIHPRQCGSVSFCDPDSNYTCQLQINYGQRCKYSYSCLSGNCDYKTNTCQSNTLPFSWILPLMMSSVFVFVMMILIIVVIAARRRRLRALAYYQTPYLIVPAGTPYSYQNSCIVGETPPPPYSGPMTTTVPKTYQS